MNKYLKFLPALCLLSFSIRAVYLGVSISEALALLVFASLYAFNHWLEKQDVAKALPDETLQIEIDKLKSSIGAIKVAQSQQRRL